MPAKKADPALKSASWRQVRAYWIRRRVSMCEAAICLLPGVPIRYDGKRGPDSLDVGHVVPRMYDRERTTWSVSETRPEHQRCSRAHGARLRAAYVRSAVHKAKGKPYIASRPTLIDNDF